MVTTNKKRPLQGQEIQDFSNRLNELLDARNFPAKGKGRQVELGKRYSLTQKAVRKWVEGEGLPEIVRLIQISRDFGCNFEWLATGNGPRDSENAEPGPFAELFRRIDSAPPETVRMIELALMPDADLEKANLSPSLKGLIGFVKHQIREESQP